MSWLHTLKGHGYKFKGHGFYPTRRLQNNTSITRIVNAWNSVRFSFEENVSFHVLYCTSYEHNFSLRFAHLTCMAVSSMTYMYMHLPINITIHIYHISAPTHLFPMPTFTLSGSEACAISSFFFMSFKVTGP